MWCHSHASQNTGLRKFVQCLVIRQMSGTSIMVPVGVKRRISRIGVQGSKGLKLWDFWKAEHGKALPNTVGVNATPLAHSACEYLIKDMGDARAKDKTSKQERLAACGASHEKPKAISVDESYVD